MSSAPSESRRGGVRCTSCSRRCVLRLGVSDSPRRHLLGWPGPRPTATSWPGSASKSSTVASTSSSSSDSLARTRRRNYCWTRMTIRTTTRPHTSRRCRRPCPVSSPSTNSPNSRRTRRRYRPLLPLRSRPCRLLAALPARTVRGTPFRALALSEALAPRLRHTSFCLGTCVGGVVSAHCQKSSTSRPPRGVTRNSW